MSRLFDVEIYYSGIILRFGRLSVILDYTIWLVGYRYYTGVAQHSLHIGPLSLSLDLWRGR